MALNALAAGAAARAVVVPGGLSPKRSKEDKHRNNFRHCFKRNYFFLEKREDITTKLTKHTVLINQ